MAVIQNNSDDTGTQASGGTENASKSATPEGNSKTNFASSQFKKLHEALLKSRQPPPFSFGYLLKQLSSNECLNKVDHQVIIDIGHLLKQSSLKYSDNDFCLVWATITDSKSNTVLSPAVGILFNLFDETLKEKAFRSIVKHDDYEIVMTVTTFCSWAETTTFCNNLHKYIIAILKELQNQNTNSHVIIKEIAKKVKIKHLFKLILLPVFQPTVAPIAIYLIELMGDSEEFVKQLEPPIVSHVIQTLYAKDMELFTKVVSAFSKLRHQKYFEILNYLQKHLNGRLPYNCQVIERSNINDKFYLRHNKNPKVGLVNLGNTCYMNSVLQALAMTKEFSREILLCGNKTPLLRSLQELVALMLLSPRPELTPSRLLNVATPSNFTPGFQQDSSEFLAHLLEALHQHESTTRSPIIRVNQIKMLPDFDNTDQNETFTMSTSMDFDINIDLDGTETIKNEGGASCSNTVLSPTYLDLTKSTDLTTTIDKIFTGKLVTTYECMSCGLQSKILDAFRDLQLSFPEKKDNCATNYTVQDLIKYYCKRETLNGDNQYFCSNCKKLCDAARFINVINAPKYLILTLKHFRYDQKVNMRAKLLHKVLPEKNISFRVYSQEDLTEVADVQYSLYAGVVHSGFSMDSGHYYTYGTDSEDRWYKFNDNIVSVSNIAELYNLTPPNTPYILFYQMRRKTTTDKFITLDELPTELRDYVDSDNALYNDEIRKRNRMIMGQSLGYRNSNSSSGRGDQDDDNDDQPSSNACNNSYNSKDKYVF